MRMSFSTINCSFCGKSVDNVAELVAGAAISGQEEIANICEQCLIICMDTPGDMEDINSEERGVWRDKAASLRRMYPETPETSVLLQNGHT